MTQECAGYSASIRSELHKILITGKWKRKHVSPSSGAGTFQIVRSHFVAWLRVGIGTFNLPFDAGVI